MASLAWIPRALWLVSLAAVLANAGCDPSAPADAGSDASQDVRMSPDTPRDTGPPCELSCALAEACCFVDEVPTCTNVSSDVSNCGGCAVDCVATHRGDSCMNNQCACGTFDVGCTGTVDECCPGVPGGLQTHCANVQRAFLDCGECGHTCTDGEASECRNGSCICGSADRACAGTDEDQCCGIGPTGMLYGCVDTLTDLDNCGSCGVRCRIDQRCASGTCVLRRDTGTPADFDAGADGGEADGGEPDAGLDAG